MPGQNSWSQVPRGVRDRLRAEVFARDGYRCQVRLPGCTGGADELDHTVSRVDGGALLDTGNMRASCTWCNRSSGGRKGNRRKRAKANPTSRSW